ncbi:MAG TPA: S53 family peptidase [Streptosporangiaceae bacterium]|jgi:subtilase family serine protease|nr:S53 family peptidase [Streptosporangiaceae bacterium]
MAAGSIAAVSSGAAIAPGAAAAGPAPVPFAIPLGAVPGSKPPTTAQCVASEGIPCYGPSQIQAAYNMAPLYKAGHEGKGKTIVLVDAFGSPSIKTDLAGFDKGYNLPAPPSFKIITPEGKPGSNSNWALETTLDVEWAHAMAPQANILLVETTVNETIGTAGFPQIVKAEKYVLNHKLGDVISQSFGTAEQTFPSHQSIMGLRGAYTLAAKDKVTVLAGSGDAGVSSPSDAAQTTFFTKRVANWPASDPLVTGVGGTQLHLNQAGARTAPDNVWNDTALLGSPAAGGGGVSSVFSRPSFQSSVASVTGNHRGVPDVSLTAAVDGAAVINFNGSWSLVGGTSWATPTFAGIVAVADQVAGHDLGDLNPALYKLGPGSAGLPDITAGNNTVSFTQGGKSYTVKGYTATKGYDLASGLGTINGAKLVAALAANQS